MRRAWLAAWLMGCGVGRVESSSPTDTTAPTIAFTSPTAGAVLDVGIVQLAGTAADDDALARVEVSVDGGAFELASGLEDWSFDWDASSEGPGEYTLTAAAIDTAGNRAETTLHVSVAEPTPDTTAPTIAITAPANASRHNANVTLAGTAQDDRALTAVEVSVSSGPFAPASGLGTWTFGVAVGSLADGPIDLVVRATDGTGNTSTDTISIVLDRAAPMAELLNAPANITADTGFSIAVAGADVVSYQYNLDDSGWVGPFSVDAAPNIEGSGLADGAHAIQVVGADDLGNWQSETSPTTHAWTVDTTHPVAALSSLPAFTSSQDIAVTVSGANVVTYSYQIDTAPWVSDVDLATTAIIAAAGLTEGPHTLRVLGKNLTGTEQTTPTEITWTVDITAPTLSLSPSSPPSPTNGASLSFTLQSDEPVTWSWTLARVGTGANCSTLSGSSATVMVLHTTCEGTYTLTADAVDRAGLAGVTAEAMYVVDRVAPALSVDAAPTSPTNASSTSFDVSTDEPTTISWELTRTGAGCPGPSSGTGAPINVANDACDGSYTLEVAATDDAGNVSTPALRTYTVDRTAPVVALTPAAPTTPTNTPSTSFGASANETATFAWSITRTGAGCPAVASPTGADVVVDNTPCDGAYTVAVVGTDSAGNGASAVVRNYEVDRTAPTFTLTPTSPTSPTAAATSSFVATSAESVTFNWTVTRVGTGCTNDADSATHSSVAIEVDNTVCLGSYTLAVTAADAVGNLSDATSRLYDVIAAVPPSGVAAFWGGPDPSPIFPSRNATVEWVLVRPNSDVTQYTYTTSGASSLSGSGTFTGEHARLRLTGLGEGTTHLTVCLGDDDDVFQAACGSTRSVTVDTLAPAPPSLTAGPGGAPFSGWEPAFTFALPTDTTLSYRVQSDGGDLYGVGDGSDGALVLRGLPDGAYTLTAWTVDAAGNSSTELDTPFELQRRPARFELTGLPPRYTTSENVTANVTVDPADIDRVDSYRYRLNGGAFGAVTDIATPIAATVASGGWQSLQVEITDSAGNTSRREYRWFYRSPGYTTYYVDAAALNNLSDCLTPSTPCRDVDAAIAKDTPSDRVVLLKSGTYGNTGYDDIQPPGSQSTTVVGGFNADYSDRTGTSSVRFTLSSSTGRRLICNYGAAHCGLISTTLVRSSGGAPLMESGDETVQTNVVDSVFNGGAVYISHSNAYVDGNVVDPGSYSPGTVANTVAAAIFAHFVGSIEPDRLVSITHNQVESVNTGIHLYGWYTGGTNAGYQALIANNTVTYGSATASEGIVVSTGGDTVPTYQPAIVLTQNTVTALGRGISVQSGQTDALRLLVYDNDLGTVASPLVPVGGVTFAYGITSDIAEPFNPLLDTYRAFMNNRLHLSKGLAPCSRTNPLVNATFAFANEIFADTCATTAIAGVASAASGNVVAAASAASGSKGVDQSALSGPTEVLQNEVTLGSGTAYLGYVGTLLGNIFTAGTCLTDPVIAEGEIGRVLHNAFSCDALATSPMRGQTSGGADTDDYTVYIRDNTFTRSSTTVEYLDLDPAGRASIEHNTFTNVAIRVAAAASADDVPIRIVANTIHINGAGHGIRLDGTGVPVERSVTIANNSIIGVGGIYFFPDTPWVADIVGNTILSDRPVATSGPIGALGNNLFVRLGTGTAGWAVCLKGGVNVAPAQAFANSYGRFAFPMSVSPTTANCASTEGTVLADLQSSHEGINEVEAAFVDAAGGNLHLSASNDCAVLSGGLQSDVVVPGDIESGLLEVRGLDGDQAPRTMLSAPAPCALGISRGYVEMD